MKRRKRFFLIFFSSFFVAVWKEISVSSSFTHQSFNISLERLWNIIDNDPFFFCSLSISFFFTQFNQLQKWMNIVDSISFCKINFLCVKKGVWVREPQMHPWLIFYEDGKNFLWYILTYTHSSHLIQDMFAYALYFPPHSIPKIILSVFFFPAKEFSVNVNIYTQTWVRIKKKGEKEMR